MSPRLRLVMMTLTAVLVATLAGVVLAGGPSRTTGPAPPGDSSPTGFDGAAAPPIPPLDFSLTDQDGRPASLREYRGQLVILTFMYSTCQDTCPVMAAQIRGALDDLGQNIPALAVSVDPANDTPLNAKRFLFKASMTGRLRFLLGSRAKLAPIWKAYGIAPQTPRSKQSDHSAYVLLIDKRGRQKVAFPQSELTPEGLAHDLRMLEREAG
jgi:protein SCO1/2